MCHSSSIFQYIDGDVLIKYIILYIYICMYVYLVYVDI